MTDATTLRRRLLLPAAVLLAGLLFARCSSTEPEPDDVRPESQLNILRLPPGHPPFFNDSVAFYARPNRSAEGRIHFQEPGGGRGDAFAELKIDSQSLLARADGSVIAPGDSVLVVMKVAGSGLLMVELRPSGLRFNPGRPAELKLDYDKAGRDLDGDGDEDERDVEIETRLAIWRQARPGDPFVKVGTVKVEDRRELKAFLTSFSRYAISY
jgi:hypothetical protein